MAIINNTPNPVMVDGTTIIGTKAPAELIPKYWGQKIWTAGIRKSYFERFMGKGSGSIIQIVTELQKKNGDMLRIPLRLPLTGAGRVGDEVLEGFEETIQHRYCDVTINQLRHATKLEGRFAEKMTELPLREEASESLSDWLGDYLDMAWFSIFTGTEHPFIQLPTDTFAFTIEPPSANRTVYAGGWTAVSSITSTDVFNTDMIVAAKLKAREDPYTCIRPVKVDGRDTYVMLIHPYQARDLKADEKWINAQQFANVRGEKNPIFTGALGVYDGVVVHEHERVPRTDDGNTGTAVGHALLLGAQAGIFAEGESPRYVTKEFDYDNQVGFAISRMCGMKKASFKYDGTTDTDFGVLNVMTAAVA